MVLAAPVVLLVTITVSAIALASGARSSDGNPADGLLFVQTAESGAFQPAPTAGPNRYRLTLNGVSPVTVVFTDAPARQFAAHPNEAFFEAFERSEPFAPNAAVILADGDAASDVIIVVLRDVTYDPTALTMAYDVELLGDVVSDGLSHVRERVDPSLPENFGFVSLFIDAPKGECALCEI